MLGGCGEKGTLLHCWLECKLGVSLVHFEFLFVCGVSRCYNFIILHVAALCSQHHFLHLGWLVQMWWTNLEPIIQSEVRKKKTNVVF